MGLSHASLLSSLALIASMICGSAGTKAGDGPSWIASNLRARTSYGADVAQSTVAWSVADKLKVQVRLEKGGQHHEAEYLWKTAKAPADTAQAALAQLVAKRGGPPGGPVNLSVGTGEKESSDPLESSARDAITSASHLHYTQALTAQKWAQALAANGQISESIAATRLGITALGNRYESPGMIDDTEMNLIAAEAAERNGRQSEARGLLEGVLRGRLAAYQKLRGPAAAQ